jgi:hypothetical protein
MKATQHCVTNHVIAVDGDSAHSTSYVIAQHVRQDDVTFTLGGTYHDDFVRRGPSGASQAGASSPRGRPVGSTAK